MYINRSIKAIGIKRIVYGESESAETRWQCFLVTKM